jgi:hypothetical protein
LGESVATRISVTVKGPMGLDDPDRMRADLMRATSVHWQAQEVDRGPVLAAGIVEIVLTAVIGKGVEMSVEAAVDAVTDLLRRWRATRLDPLEMAVDTDPVPDDDPVDVTSTDGVDG